MAIDSRVIRAPDGSYWCDSASASREWPRYLRTFTRVAVLARARNASPPPNLVQIDTSAVDVIALPDFGGVLSLAAALPRIRRILTKHISDDAVIVRSPGFVSTLAVRHARRRRIG